MATPSNAPYKKRQRTAEKAYRNRGEVIWVSCATEGADVQGMMIKRSVQGTKRINRGPRGKAMLKHSRKARQACRAGY